MMMARTEPPKLGLLPKFVIGVALLLVAAGIIWHGVTYEGLRRFNHDLFERPGGPMSFRFILQPAMATIAAIHDGLNDARTGRSPYFWTVLTKPDKRTERMNECLISTGRIVLLGLAMDTLYQFKVFDTFYPAEAVLIALLLACVPYFLIRGPVERIARWYWRNDPPGAQS
jgi:hypothetical protein